MSRTVTTLGGALLAAGALLGLASRRAGATLDNPNASDESLLTLAELRACMPSLSATRATELLPHLRVALAEAHVTTYARMTFFLAQLAHESGDLRYFEEKASGEAYEGRESLGNTQPGDGVRYKGRGPIQLTGRYNYRAAGKALGLPLEAQPELAKQDSVGFRVAGWYWTSRDLNALADAGDFVGVTKKINGGVNGLADRQLRLERARTALSKRRKA